MMFIGHFECIYDCWHYCYSLTPVLTRRSRHKDDPEIYRRNGGKIVMLAPEDLPWPTRAHEMINPVRLRAQSWLRTWRWTAIVASTTTKHLLADASGSPHSDWQVWGRAWNYSWCSPQHGARHSSATPHSAVLGQMRVLQRTSTRRSWQAAEQS